MITTLTDASKDLTEISENYSLSSSIQLDQQIMEKVFDGFLKKA